MAKYDISRGERILCIGTLACIIETDRYTKEIRVPRGLEDHLVGINFLYSGLSFDDSLLWAAVVIAASNNNPQLPSTNKWLILDRILDLDADDGLLSKWEDVHQRMRTFFRNIAVENSWEDCWEIALYRRQKRVKN